MRQEQAVKDARMRAATQRVPAGLAFDQKRRVDALRAKQEAAAKPPEPPPEQRSAPAGLDTPGAGRNDPCPCGSGKKYKKCHGQGL
jgi:preprotein translocase subunit SecA